MALSTAYYETGDRFRGTRIGDLRVDFLGFESTLIQLERHGWDVAAHLDEYRMMTVFAMKHRYIKLCAWSDEYQLQDSNRIMINQVAPLIELVKINTTCSFSNWRELTPDIMMHDNAESLVHPETSFIDNLPCFSDDTTLYEASDKSVTDQLEAILSSQKDKQKELRQKTLSTLTAKPNIIKLVGT